MENSQSIIKSCWLIREVPFTLSGKAEKGGASFLILRASKLLTNILQTHCSGPGIREPGVAQKPLPRDRICSAILYFKSCPQILLTSWSRQLPGCRVSCAHELEHRRAALHIWSASPLTASLKANGSVPSSLQWDTGD